MNEGNQLKIGAILSYMQMFLSIAIELIYTPLMIRALGRNEYGLYNTAASTISMLSILNFGFNSSYIRYYQEYKVKNEVEKIYKLNAMFLSTFIGIGFIALVSGVYLSCHLELIFHDGLTKDELRLAQKLMLLLTINLAASFPMSVFANIISAHEKFIFSKTINMIRTVLGPMLSMPILLLGFRSVTLVIVTLIVSIIADLCNLYYTHRVLHEKFIFRNYDIKLFKDLFIYTSFIAINIVVDQINNNIDNLLLARFRGTAGVAIYAVSQRLYTAYVRFSTSISGVFTPRVHKIVNSLSDKKELSEALTTLFVKIGRIQFLILALIASGIIFWGKQFIYLWAGKEFTDSYYVCLLLILPSSIALIQNVGIEIQRALNRHQFRSICYFIMALINLVLSWFLCQTYGAVGTAIGTSVSLIVANGFIINIYYHKKCYLNIVEFWENIISLSRGLILPIFFGILFSTLFRTQNLLVNVFQIIAYCFIYAISMWIFGMTDDEKNLFKQLLIKIHLYIYNFREGNEI